MRNKATSKPPLVLQCPCGGTLKTRSNRYCDDDWGRFWETEWIATCDKCGIDGTDRKLRKAVDIQNIKASEVLK